jgi:PAS domain S-box-containing protein
MTFSLTILFSAGIVYLSLMFLTAYAVERQWIPMSIARHPSVYILALGVYCSAWAYYGTTGLAFEYGYGYLTYYLGISAAFVLFPFILRPFLRITRTYELGSLADVFAFRYRSRWAGSLTALFMILVIMPLLALQIQAITDATRLLNPGSDAAPLGLAFCFTLTAFTILYGARKVAPRERHYSLMFAVAAESLFKVIVFILIGVYGVLEVFGGLPAMNEWLANNTHLMVTDSQPLTASSNFILMLMFLIAPLTMPHMFQILFRENRNPGSLKRASWIFPIYLLLMSVPVLPVLWSSLALNQTAHTEFHALTLSIYTDSPVITLLVYLGGLSAASGLMIVATLSLASMSLNHLILPIRQPGAEEDIYHWLLWIRRALIFTIIIAGYLVYLALGQVHNLSSLGIAAFVGALQFLPGIIGVLFWNKANRKGFITGLTVGVIIWMISILYPLFADSFLMTYRIPLQFALDQSAWSVAAMLATGINGALFIAVSLFTNTSREELDAADACFQNALTKQVRRRLVAQNSDQFIESLSRALGKVTAEREVYHALRTLGLPNTEYRPYALRRLRDRIEANLSGLMGPSVAQAIVQHYLPYTEQSDLPGRDDIHFIESRLENFHSQLTGLSAELDSLRRFHRQTLENLPIGVCSLGSDGEVLMWNEAMVDITGIESHEIIGSYLTSLPAAWHELLNDFLHGHSTHAYKKELKLSDRTHWINLHKASLPQSGRTLSEGTVVLVEDQTDIQLLEDELVHSERLASIGGLAAGVAHEIGNPITGIDCLAQDLLYSQQDPEIQQTAKQIMEQTRRVTSIVQSLVNFAHAGNQEGKNRHLPHPIYDVVQEAIQLLQLSRDSGEVVFDNRLSREVNVICDPQRLSQVFVNLLSNARDASPAGETITISQLDNDVSQQVVVEVLDRGSGIAPEHLERIFDPFYTTKDVGKGTGLGLWLAYSIVEEHFGQITIESPAFDLQTHGTRVIITLPDADGNQESRKESP